ncbi:AdeC/AdeK/OprM family multidrug efflux complex outer membrane factor [Bordetella holmesii]|uniref:Outer membrane efflux protein OprM n=2 Tax=Bordetella holmesii TaxID=35814 RepID=A0A158M8N5_9BORD|nr:AdeC/AdeK/OprM family multidrug efflux complex outer membrane factor [Bordetella holmesii]AHV92373.1 outer membrane protein oprM [Bordetella holmesii ATCC 51541]AIT27960.1 outer membrane protein oprM [Bordetella holmesii 44057]EWM40737.1 outer membrane protein oprM [Bordetella holmesii 35009]EWM43686.1 outer membrane protein oprM [Bordetella holmesii 41130]EWM44633.1 outer membrane protein oprM [Bordetella holmesii 70147]
MIPTMKTLLSMSLAGALAGCSLAPTYQRPDAPVDTLYPSGPAYGVAAQQPAGQVAAADVGWREFFHDPLLQRIIALALANNRDMRVAALNVEAARAQYRIQRADLLPSLGVAGDTTVQRSPGDLTQTGRPEISRQYRVGGAISSWELDLFGRIQSLSEQALQTYLAQDETRIATQLALIAETAQAYLTLRADQELLQLTKDTLSSQENSYKLTKQSYDQGVGTALDLSQAEISLRTAQRNQSQYLRQVAQDRNALTLLAGQPLPADVLAQLDESKSLPDDIVIADLPAGLPSDLLSRRPDVRAAEHVLRGANANIGAARAAFFPSISLTGMAGTASASLGGLFKAGSGAWSFAPQISLPIFAGGSLMADLDLAHVRKRIEVANYEKAIQTGFREVADGLAGRATLDDQIAAQRLLVDASQRAYTLSDQRFRQGVADYLSVLDSQRSLYTAQQALVDTRLSRLTNLITLYKSLGGGWTEHTVSADAATTASSQ